MDDVASDFASCAGPILLLRGGFFVMFDGLWLERRHNRLSSFGIALSLYFTRSCSIPHSSKSGSKFGGDPECSLSFHQRVDGLPWSDSKHVT